MDEKSRQKALDDLGVEELDKIKAHQAATKGSVPIDEEWLLLGEFAKAYGFEAYLAVKEDRISSAEMMALIEASRKLRYIEMFQNAQTSFIGAVSSQTKKPVQIFSKLTKEIIKRTKI